MSRNTRRRRRRARWHTRIALGPVQNPISATGTRAELSTAFAHNIWGITVVRRKRGRAYTATVVSVRLAYLSASDVFSFLFIFFFFCLNAILFFLTNTVSLKATRTKPIRNDWSSSSFPRCITILYVYVVLRV